MCVNELEYTYPLIAYITALALASRLLENLNLDVKKFLDIGIYSFEENEWQWGMAPEIGVIIPLKGNGSIIINGKYNYAFTVDNPMGGDINHEYWMLGIGYAWGRH